MADILTADEFYTKRIKDIISEGRILGDRRRLVSWGRLAAIVLFIVIVVILWQSGIGNIVMAGFPVLVIFGILVSYTIRLDESILHNRKLREINEDEKNGLSGKYRERFDGIVYLGNLGSSGNDLDVFGPGSLYPFINRAFTEEGKNLVATWLTHSAKRENILEKQLAVKELKDQPLWRQQLQAYGMRNPNTLNSRNVIEEWLNSGQSTFQKPIWWILRFAVPLISFSTVIVYWFDLIPDQAFNIAMLLILAFALWIGKMITIEYGRLSKIVDELESFGHLLHTVEQGKFVSTYLLLQQSKLNEDQRASQKIRALRKILNRFDYRLNPLVYIPLSIFLLWDLQQIFSLEKWKRSHTGKISNWFNAVGEMEAVSSLANLSFNHSHWVFPTISEQWFELEGEQLGHPLIQPSKSVTNNFSMKGTGLFVILTGSNMAGKSTFLRTLGTNMILAMAGGPVCAAKFTIPVLKVMSSMRIMDNLEEETSTFYAELKKLKTILEAVKLKEHIFLLLDEMLRGTNAIDRHTGSVALIRQLIKYNAVGIIASHDISLTGLSADYPGNIENYHFDSTVENNEIIFDYRLKDGICTSTNATLLMKKIGIDIDEKG